MGRPSGRGIWGLACAAALAACRMQGGADGRGVTPDAGVAPDDAGVVVQTGSGPFVDQNGFHYASKTDCLAKTDGDFVVLDRDGDGHTAWWLQRCNDATPQYGFHLAGADDCDDSNPSVYRNAWPDADGDGVTVDPAACVADVPAGYLGERSPLPDCNDADRAVSRTLYTDADGDGYGSPDAPACVAAAAPDAPDAPDAPAPPGFAANDTDCDDNDASVHPKAPELWRDGVDSDCNGGDDPLTCGGANPSCGCELLAETRVPIDPACAGSNLFVVKQVSCLGCFGQTVLTLGNRGTKAASLVSVNVDGVSFPSLGVLAPGAVTLPIVLPYAAHELQITALTDECNLADNVQTLQSSSGVCDP